MLEHFPGSRYVALGVILTAGLLRWWWGRSMGALVDDPAFPERLAAHRLRTTRAFGVVAALLVAGWADEIFWTLPLFLLACSLASFPFRRTVFQETWSVGSYLSFFTRAVFALWGFWLTLALFPSLAHAAGSMDWLVALSVGIALAFWNGRHSDSLRFILRSRPVADAALTSRFTALAQAAQTRMPSFEVVDLRGGTMTNAFALPSISRPAVIFTDGLLAKLDADEIAAICGHELAHLEHYNPALLRRMSIHTYILIAGGVAAALLARLLADSQLGLMAGWSMVVAMFMAWRVRDRQKHETESDLRAVALTRDPEALARALIKIHAFAHVPRRMDIDLERQSTHPSLASRIRAIRAMASAPQPALDLNAAFAAADGGTRATFAEDHLLWQEGDAATHNFSYTHLSEVRIRVGASGPARLLAVERGGRRWEMPLVAGDVARAQAVLDRVDVRLPGPVGGANLWPGVGRILVVAIALLATLSMCVSVLWVTVLAFLRPARTMLAASGAAALAAVVLTVRDTSSTEWAAGVPSPFVPIALAIAGVLAILAAIRAQAEAPSKTGDRFLYILGVIAAISTLLIAAQSTSAVRLHQATRAMPAAMIFPVAFAAALAIRPGRRSRILSLASSFVGIAIAVVGSMTFLTAAGRDVLLVASGPLTRTKIQGDAEMQFDIPVMTSDVRLSPDGRHIAAHDSDTEDESSVFHVGRPGEELIRVVAGDVQFVDDTRALAARDKTDGMELSEIVLNPQATVRWRHLVPDVHRAQLSIRTGSPRWRLLGWDRARHLLSVEGEIGSTDVSVTRWPLALDRDVWPQVVAATRTDAVLLETRFEGDYLHGGTLSRVLDVFNPGSTFSRLWHLGQDRHSPIGVSYLVSQCFPYGDGDQLVCSAFDGVRTHVVAIDAATAKIEPLATLDGHFASYWRPVAGWLTGWCDSSPAAIRLRTREVITIPDDEDDDLMGVTASDRWVGAITAHGKTSRLRLFRLEH